MDGLKETFDKCMANGRFKEKNEIDIELIKSLKEVSEKCLSFINERSRDIKKDSSDWTFVFRDYYESLRGLVEAFLLFDKIEAERHQCKNAYLCSKHPELEFDWEFLEAIRLRRNAINYKGELLSYDSWRKLKLQFELYINTLKKAIENRLGQR
jgi:hypothetical protein